MSGIEADILIQGDKISQISPNIKENGHILTNLGILKFRGKFE